MGYWIKTVRAGRVVEVWKYRRPAQPPSGSRSNKQNPTPAQQMEINRRNAETKLRWILNDNFKPGDFHLVLTYQKGGRPTPEQAKGELDRFLRSLRAEIKKTGTELKYISVTEYKGRAIHHHLVCSACDPAIINRLWQKDSGHGRPHITLLDHTGQYAELAGYLIKETDRTFRNGTAPSRKRWNESRNLTHPKPVVRRVKARQWRADPKPWKGYYLDKGSVASGVDGFTGQEWQRFSMIRILPERARGKKP